MRQKFNSSPASSEWLVRNIRLTCFRIFGPIIARKFWQV